MESDEITFSLNVIGELNDFINAKKAHKLSSKTIKPTTTIKDAIESSGIPHTEVGKIVVNEYEVDFNYKPKDGDEVSVYPFKYDNEEYELLDNPLRLQSCFFIVDCNVAKIVKYLRMLGFSVYYEDKIDDNKIADIANENNFIVLTRDKNLLKHKKVTFGRYIRAIEVHKQIKEIVNFFELKDKQKPFSRCLICNAQLEHIEKSKIIDRLPKSVRVKFNEFKFCSKCDKVYWNGSHYKKMFKFIESV